MQAVYLLDIKDIAQNEGKIVPLLDKCLTLKVESFAKKEDRLRSIGSFLLIRAFTAPSGLKYNEYGKPYKTDKPYFNVSHSGNRVGIFINDQADVGIDIQEIKAFNKNLLQYFFAEERKLIKTDKDFAKLWSMKESAVKCLGGSVVFAKNKSIIDVKNDYFIFGEQKFYYKSEFLSLYAVTLCSLEPFNAEILEIDCEFIIKTLAKRQPDSI